MLEAKPQSPAARVRDLLFRARSRHRGGLSKQQMLLRAPGPGRPSNPNRPIRHQMAFNFRAEDLISIHTSNQQRVWPQAWVLPLGFHAERQLKKEKRKKTKAATKPQSLSQALCLPHGTKVGAQKREKRDQEEESHRRQRQRKPCLPSFPPQNQLSW